MHTYITKIGKIVKFLSDSLIKGMGIDPNKISDDDIEEVDCDDIDETLVKKIKANHKNRRSRSTFTTIENMCFETLDKEWNAVEKHNVSLKEQLKEIKLT